ncbi:MAG: hypothetical protein HWN71_02840 [Desulfobacterales bacterium]|nr:hypothetical protein [Desulfobacterales bacterium]
MDQGSNCRCDFREVQRFRKGWLWVLLLSTALFVLIVFGYGMLKQLVLGEPWGRRPMSDTALAIVGPLAVLLVVGLNYFFYALKLVIEVRRDGLYIHFFPLVVRKYPSMTSGTIRL